MSAADRLDEIEARAKGQPWVSELYADNAALVAALRAVLELHALNPFCGNWHHNPHQCPCAVPACADGCDTYPCPTVRAIEEALS